MPVKVDVNANTIKWVAIVGLGVYVFSQMSTGINKLLGGFGGLAGAGGNIADAIARALNGITSAGEDLAKSMKDFSLFPKSDPPAPPPAPPGFDPFKPVPDLPGMTAPTPEQMWNYEERA